MSRYRGSERFGRYTAPFLRKIPFVLPDFLNLDPNTITESAAVDTTIGTLQSVGNSKSLRLIPDTAPEDAAINDLIGEFQ